jgi:hypothetical protein
MFTISIRIMWNKIHRKWGSHEGILYRPTAHDIETVKQKWLYCTVHINYCYHSEFILPAPLILAGKVPPRRKESRTHIMKSC